jgi:HAD superfamily hydrolase (TIGR01549 family)
MPNDVMTAGGAPSPPTRLQTTPVRTRTTYVSPGRTTHVSPRVESLRATDQNPTEESEAEVTQIAILDVDGTLVDTNYHHAIAWFRAFRRHDVTVPVWRIHRHIGLGGDQLVAAVAGDEVEERLGDEIHEAESELYRELIDEVQTMEGARELIEELREAGNVVVLASSAKDWEVEHCIELLDVGEIVDGWTTSSDVERTKPKPDLVRAALEKAGTEGDAMLIGDTVWDVEAARRAGVETLAVLSGGFSEQELRDAGARDVFTSVEELRKSLVETPLSA